jgi:hypothetical protein
MPLEKLRRSQNRQKKLITYTVFLFAVAFESTEKLRRLLIVKIEVVTLTAAEIPIHG